MAKSGRPVRKPLQPSRGRGGSGLDRDRGSGEGAVWHIALFAWSSMAHLLWEFSSTT